MGGVKPYYADDSVTLYHGDSLDVLRTLPDGSVDSVVTDPPYGLEFMGKGWDGADGFRRSLNLADAGRANVFGRASTKAPEYRAGALFQEWCEQWATECLRALRPGGHMLAFGGTRTWHRLACAVEDAGFEIRDSLAWLYGSGFPKSLNLVDDEGERTGWGTALKPAFEPIVVARKPLAGTVAANVLAHGTGALNIDGCRIGSDERENPPGSTRPRVAMGGGWREDATPTRAVGRWPTNVILDDSQADALDQQSGDRPAGGKVTGRQDAKTGDNGIYGAFGAVENKPYDDEGGASRFFVRASLTADDLAIAERFRYCAKAGSDERPVVNGTAHPTVKPLAFIRWLARLVTRAGGTVLEPFTGSGTTVEACLLEGFNIIAIEREDEYLPLIEYRIARHRDPVRAIELAGGDMGLLGYVGGAA